MSAGSLSLAMLALLGVVALILVTRRVALLLPRLGGLPGRAGGGGPLRLEQAIALDTRRRLLLVRCGPRRVLLLTGGTQDVVVGWLDPASENPELPP